MTQVYQLLFFDYLYRLSFTGELFFIEEDISGHYLRVIICPVFSNR